MQTLKHTARLAGGEALRKKEFIRHLSIATLAECQQAYLDVLEIAGETGTEESYNAGRVMTEMIEAVAKYRFGDAWVWI